MQDGVFEIKGHINDTVAAVVVKQILDFWNRNSEDVITLYISSEGGTVTAGVAIYDVIRHVSNPVSTIAVGKVAGIATLILVVSSFLSGFVSARIRTEKGLITGAITGLVFYLIVVVLSLVILRSAVTSSLIIKLAILCFASSIGGLLGVNRSAKYKKII